jgi:hypothetical protein
MRKVFNNRQLAHVWAQQSQPEGRGNNFFFDGPALFSYGRHFCVARYVQPEDKGEPVVLMNSSRYSNSTNRHQSYARGAVYGLPVRAFNVPDTDAHGREPWRHADNLRYYASTIAAHALRAARSRVHVESELRAAERVAAEGARYCQAFKLPKRLWPKAPDVSPEAMAAIRERDRKARAERARAKAELDAAYREEWRRGKYRTAPDGGPTMLRVSRDGMRVETSRGAEVPVEDARRILRLWRDRGDTSREWPHGEGPRVGQFTLREVRADGALIIGCHVFEPEELARMADTLGVTE